MVDCPRIFSLVGAWPWFFSKSRETVHKALSCSVEDGSQGRTGKGRLSSIIRLGLGCPFTVVCEVQRFAFASGLLCDGSLYGLAGHGLVWPAVGPCWYARSVSFVTRCCMFRSI